VEQPLSRDAFVWGIASLCNLHRIPFDAELLIRRFPPAYDLGVLLSAIKSFGFKVSLQAGQIQPLHPAVFPVLVLLNPPIESESSAEPKAESREEVRAEDSASSETPESLPEAVVEAEAEIANTNSAERIPEYGLALVVKTDGERILLVTQD
jgi:hypothetical protein